MKNFIRCHLTAFTVLGILSFILNVYIVALLIFLAETERIQLVQFDRQPAALIQQHDLSDRSKLEIKTFVNNEPRSLGAWAFRRNFTNQEFPLFFYYTHNPVIEKFVLDWHDLQKSRDAISTEDLEAMPGNSFNNEKETIIGDVRCVKTANTSMRKISPDVIRVAPTICLVTFPLFEVKKEADIALAFVFSSNLNDPYLETIKRKILSVQIDVFNRDYKGRETWDYPQ